MEKCKHIIEGNGMKPHQCDYPKDHEVHAPGGYGWEDHEFEPMSDVEKNCGNCNHEQEGFCGYMPKKCMKESAWQPKTHVAEIGKKCTGNFGCTCGCIYLPPLIPGEPTSPADYEFDAAIEAADHALNNAEPPESEGVGPDTKPAMIEGLHHFVNRLTREYNLLCENTPKGFGDWALKNVPKMLDRLRDWNKSFCPMADWTPMTPAKLFEYHAALVQENAKLKERVDSLSLGSAARAVADEMKVKKLAEMLLQITEAIARKGKDGWTLEERDYWYKKVADLILEISPETEKLFNEIAP